MKPTFLKYEKPLLTAMLQSSSLETLSRRIKLSLEQGAEAFGIQTESLLLEDQTPEIYRQLFDQMGDKPIYVTHYRMGGVRKKTDEQIARELVLLAKTGATLCDVMGDLFCPHPEEMTDDPDAIEKQMALIKELHEAGAEVIMSAHIRKFLPAERVLEMALEQQRRGADIVKIVVAAENMAQQMENLRIATLLKETLQVPYLFLCVGECGILRRIGGVLGCCMYLCVCERDKESPGVQPLLRQLKPIRDNMEW